MFRRAALMARGAEGRAGLCLCSVGCGGRANPLYAHFPEPWCCKRCYTSSGQEHDTDCFSHDTYADTEPAPEVAAAPQQPQEKEAPIWQRFCYEGKTWWYLDDHTFFFEDEGQCFRDPATEELWWQCACSGQLLWFYVRSGSMSAPA